MLGDGLRQVWPETVQGRVQQLLQLAGMTTAYIFAGHFARLVSLQDGLISPYYPAAGIGLAALLIFGRRGLMVPILGELMLQFTLSTPSYMLILLAAGEALGALAAWELLTRRGGRNFQLVLSSDLGKLVVAGMLYGCLAASAGMTGDYLRQGTQEHSLLLRWCIYALGDLLGVMCIVPLVLSWRRPGRTLITPQRLAEMLACGALTLGTSLLTFLRGGGLDLLRQPLSFPTFAVQVWAALRFGLRGASGATVAVSIIGMYGTALGRGPFGAFPVLEQALVLQGYILLHSMMGLLLAVLLYERQRAEEELRRQREYLRQIVDISPDIIFVKDRHHRYVFVNQAMADLYGTTIRDLLGRTDRDFVRNPELADFYSAADEEVLRTGEERFIPEEPMVDFEGKLRWVQVVKRALRDEHGIPRQVLGVGTDITARREAERQLQEQRSYLRQIVDVNPSLIFVKDEAGRFVLVNQAVATMFGVAVEDILGKTDADFNPNAEEVAFFRRMDMEVMASGEDLFIPEEVLTDSEGTRHWLQTIKRPLKDSSGKAVEVLGVATDITARKQAEEQRAELEQRMLQSQKLESMGILAGGVAHDFNNLLAAVLGNADLAMLDLDEKHPASASVRRIRTAALRASELASQMLAYSGRGSLTRSRVSLNELVEEMLSLLQAALPKGATVVRELSVLLPAVDGDPAQLRQVVMNLVTNAADALPEGSGLISIRTAVVEAEDGNTAMLEVRDNGIGMDAETLERVFDPFFTTKFTGRGLGMAAVLGIVRGLGGRIEIDSQPGSGSSVRVLIPASSGAQPQETVTAPQITGSAERSSDAHPATDSSQLSALILIVDDDPAVCSVARRALGRSGFRTLEAHNGWRALELFKAQHEEITAVLLDLTMPEISGDEVLQRMQEINPAVPIIVSSGYSEADVTARIGQQGCAGFLQKPYEVSQLVDVFRQLSASQPVQSEQ